MTRPSDARAAERSGAAYIGAVLVPGSTRLISPERARVLADAVAIPLVVVTAGFKPADAARSAIAAQARVIQLHGDETPDEVKELRTLGEWELWKAVRVRSGADVLEAIERFSTLADLILLDGWHPTGLGGMGVRFPWEALASLPEERRASVRIGASGGLAPDNVAEAVVRLEPDLVDVSSGVEASPGVKDSGKVEVFMRNALAADRDRVSSRSRSVRTDGTEWSRG